MGLKEEGSVMYSRKVRMATVAGQFYEKIPVRLKKNLEKYLQNVPDENFLPKDSVVQAVVVPHAGYAYSGKTAGKTFSLAEKYKYKRIVLIAPSHYVGFSGVALPSYEVCSTPIGDISVDLESIAKLKGSYFVKNDDAHIHEHSLEVELPFIQKLFPKTPILPLVCGQINISMAKELAEALLPFWNSETLWVISSDFTHYGRQFGYLPFKENIPENLEKLDMGAVNKILDFDLEGFDRYLNKTGATICGRNPIMLMLAANFLAKNENNIESKAKLVEYTTSGEMTGDYNHTVSYAGIVVYTDNSHKEVRNMNVHENNENYTEKQKQEILSLVRNTIRNKFDKNKNITIAPIADYLTEERSCFVTLHTNGGALRGCIGHIMAFEPLYDNLKRNAVNSAFQDPRFTPLKSVEELDTLKIEVSVLTPAREIPSYNDIVLGKHGIILKYGSRNAVFLPQVAPEQGWDLSTTLSHLSMKAGLSANAWELPETQFEVFEAIVFGE